MDELNKAEHQAAGHEGMLTNLNGSLFIKPTVQQEIEFYTAVSDGQATKSQDQHEETQLIDWMPVFLGTLEQGITENAEGTRKITDEFKVLNAKVEKKDDKQYIVLKNLLHGFKKPSIVDIKLGKVLHDENTTEEKVARLQKVSETTTSGTHHYRVCGMKLYHTDLPDLSKFEQQGHVSKDDQGYITFDKWYGRTLNSKNVKESFKIFFTHNNLTLDQKQIVIRNTFTRLQLLYNCLLSQELRIRSASLFIAYENDPTRWKEMRNDDPIFKDDLSEAEEEEDDDGDDESALAPLSLLSLIDFAHAKFTPGQKYDENLVQGIENLINDIEDLISE